MDRLFNPEEEEEEVAHLPYPLPPHIAAQASRIRANRNAAPWAVSRTLWDILRPHDAGDVAVEAATTLALPPAARLLLATAGLFFGSPREAHGGPIDRAGRRIANAVVHGAEAAEASVARASREGWGRRPGSPARAAENAVETARPPGIGHNSPPSGPLPGEEVVTAVPIAPSPAQTRPVILPHLPQEETSRQPALPVPPTPPAPATAIAAEGPAGIAPPDITYDTLRPNGTIPAQGSPAEGTPLVQAETAEPASAAPPNGAPNPPIAPSPGVAVPAIPTPAIITTRSIQQTEVPAEPPPTDIRPLTGAELEEAQRLTRQIMERLYEDRMAAESRRVRPRPQDRVLLDPDPNRRFEVPQTLEHALAARAAILPPGHLWPRVDANTGAGSLRDLMPHFDAVVQHLSRQMERGEAALGTGNPEAQAIIGRQFFNTTPIYDWLVANGWSHTSAMGRITQEARALAGTSPRAGTVLNMRGASILPNRLRLGRSNDPLSLRRDLLARPGFEPGRDLGPGDVYVPGSGYVLIPQTHGPLTDRLFQGTADIGRHPKVRAMEASTRGDLSVAPVDVHVVRGTNMAFNDIAPSALPRASFRSDAAYRSYIDAARRGAVTDEELLPLLASRPASQRIGGQVVPTEYVFYNNLMSQLARARGISPAEAQAWMRFRFGGRTGLTSHQLAQTQVLNERLSIASQLLGKPAQEIADLYFRNWIPLAGAGGLAATGSVQGLLGPPQEPRE